MKKTNLLELAYQTSILYAKDLPGEPFHPDYLKNKDAFRRLMKAHRMFEKDLKQYFYDFARRLNLSLINWMMFENKVRTASELDDWIMVDWDEEALKIKVILTDALQEAIVAGGILMQEDSKVDIGWAANSSDVLDFINKYGLKLAKGLNDTTVDKIKSALSLSIDNGEDLATAQARLLQIIDDPNRAATIARTESVKAFGAGRKSVAEEIGWEYKEWHTTATPCEICAPLPDVGRIGIDEDFDDGITEEPAHPNCRCSVRYYKNQED